MTNKFVIVLDTETANSVEQPFPYDFGWAVVDTESGKIVRKYSYVCAEIFLDKELMEQAYFAEKIPDYWEDIQKGKRKLKRLLNIRKELWNCMKTYHITKVCAYNMGFDRRASHNSVRYLTSSKIRWFFPYKTEFICIWHMACTSILNTEEYINFAIANHFVSDAGNIQTSAECAYRYLINDVEFKESHTGLEDVEIEAVILMNCLKSKEEKMKMNPYSACWMNVQKTYKKIKEES